MINKLLTNGAAAIVLIGILAIIVAVVIRSVRWILGV